MARALLDSNRVSGVDSLVCVAFAEHPDSFFSALRSQKFENSTLRGEYDALVGKALAISESYVAVQLGAWMPTGNRSLLGTHPMVGGTLGIKKNRWLGELSMGVAAFRSPNDYVVKKDSAFFTTDYFLLAYIGIEGGYELGRTMRHELDLMAGVGPQGMEAKWGDAEEDFKELRSLQISVGFDYKYYLAPYSSSFIAIQPRIELSRMDTGGGSDLSGSAFSLRVAMAWGLSRNRGEALRRLSYRY